MKREGKEVEDEDLTPSEKRKKNKLKRAWLKSTR